MRTNETILRLKMVLYIFKIHGWYKFGVAARCPWERFQQYGFWHMQHPTELCNRLNFDDVELVNVFKGGLDQELAIKTAYPGDVSEFYANDRYAKLLDLCKNLEKMSLPERPATMNEPKNFRGCCLQLGHSKRLKHVWRSKATKGKNAACPKCGKVVSIRFDKLLQHQRSRTCTGA